MKDPMFPFKLSFNSYLLSRMISKKKDFKKSKWKDTPLAFWVKQCWRQGITNAAD